MIKLLIHIIPGPDTRLFDPALLQLAVEQSVQAAVADNTTGTIPQVIVTRDEAPPTVAA